MMKPRSDGNSQGCILSEALRIQINTVREVSIVERCAADAYLVVAIPKLLKAAIEMIEQMV